MAKNMTDNIIWRFADKWTTQTVSFLITIIISRIIDPECYGVVSIVNAFVAVFGVFSDVGLCESLIQKKDADDDDFSTVFYLNTIICVIIYAVVYISSKSIENFYNMDSLANLIKVSAISIVISPFKGIQHARITRELDFKKLFFASLFGTLLSGVIGIAMAINGFGAWALVFANLSDLLIDTIFLWFINKWKPNIVFSTKSLKKLSSFGIRIFVISLLNTIYNKLYSFIIGKHYSSEDLAYYDKGETTIGKVTNNIDYAMNSVLFPSMSNKQNDKKEIKRIAKKAIKMNTYLIMPMLMGIYSVGDLFISFVYTDKWLPALLFIRIFSIKYALLPLHTINLNVIKSMGRSDILLKQELIKKILVIVMLLSTYRYGTIYIAYGTMICNFLSLVINSYPNDRLIDYGLFEQIKDIIPTVIISIIMMISVLLIPYYVSDIVTLTIKILVGIVMYFGVSFVMKYKPFFDYIDIIKHYISRLTNARKN